MQGYGQKNILTKGVVSYGAFLDITGKTYGNLKVLERVENDKYARAKWKCICQCGQYSIVSSGHLITGHTSTCGRCNKNRYEIHLKESFCILFSGEIVIFDTDDYGKSKMYQWCLDNRGYAKTTMKDGRNLKMHRLILGVEDRNLHIDHINGNRLDNRKANLRIVTNQQNCFNSKISIKNTSGYKGVSFNKRRRKYVAYISYNGVRKHLGYYQDSKEAAIAYNKSASFYFGEYARLNEIS